MNISGQKFWFSIKIACLEPTNYTIEYNRYILSDYKTMEYHSELFHGQNYLIYDMGRSGYMSSDSSEVDYYFQINLGKFNWSFYHNKQKYHESESWSYSSINYSNMTGTHYFTYFSYCDCKVCTMDIWINTSHNISISTTQGTDVFCFKREDFYGNINMGCRRGTFILNGVKEININDTMFAWFQPDGESTGFEVLEYKSPTGDYKRRTQVDIRGEPFNYNFNDPYILSRDGEQGFFQDEQDGLGLIKQNQDIPKSMLSFHSPDTSFKTPYLQMSELKVYGGLQVPIVS